jgi:hypothetical protein
LKFEALDEFASPVNLRFRIKQNLINHGAEKMRPEGLQAEAMDVLAKAGAVKECEYHHGMYINQEDPDAEKLAYVIGTNMVKAREIDGSREEFLDAIKRALTINAVGKCPICEKQKLKDD